MFGPCWSIWCQTCAGGDFSASQHGYPEPVKNLFFVRRSSHFGPFGATTGLGGDLSASWHGVPQPFENYFFVGRSSHFGTFGTKLALQAFVPLFSKTASEIEAKCEQDPRNKRVESGKAHHVSTAQSVLLQQPWILANS